jgi:AcrR family transcriptional regulator
MLKQDILTAAVQLARETGYRRVTREAVANRVGCAESTISFHFGAMSEFHQSIVEFALGHEVLDVIADALASRHPLAVAAPEALRRKAVKHLADSLR